MFKNYQKVIGSVKINGLSATAYDFNFSVKSEP